VRAPYYVKLAAFLLLASFGALAGAAAGSILGFGASVPVMYLIGAWYYASDPLMLGIITMGLGATASFVWAYLHSYRLLARHLWQG
jgi:hypothetical protein